MKPFLKAIIDAQNSDGGWGFLPARSSNTECTALCLMALQDLSAAGAESRAEGALRWLIRRQHPQGSWPLSDLSTEPSWTTALATIALARYPEHQEHTAAAAGWLLRQEGRKPGLLARWLAAVLYRNNKIELNPDLIGWPWLPSTFSWVEPTSYALVALKKIRRTVVLAGMDDRIKQGELMIYDRMCPGGGWNYGNSKVFGEALWPYPDITAVALIALQDHVAAEGNRESLAALRKMMQETQSGLALSWGAICLAIYGDNISIWRRQIENGFEKSGFLGEVKTIALSLMALNNGAQTLRI